MKRWMVVLLVCVGCGSSSPTSSPEVPEPGAPEGQMVFVRSAEVEAYIGHVQRSFESVAVMISEYTVISQSWTRGQASKYWTQQYTVNLINRVKLLREQVRGVRPENAELRLLHTEYEEALEAYQEAFELFLRETAFEIPIVSQEVNNKIAEGNVHLIRFQVILSNWTGRSLDFLRQAVG